MHELASLVYINIVPTLHSPCLPFLYITMSAILALCLTPISPSVSNPSPNLNPTPGSELIFQTVALTLTLTIIKRLCAMARFQSTTRTVGAWVRIAVKLTLTLSSPLVLTLTLTLTLSVKDQVPAGPGEAAQ